MIRVLQLCSVDPGASGPGAEDWAALVNSELRGSIGALLLRIGRGGEFRNPVEASLRLRFAHDFNLVHAWDSAALMAAIASGLPVIYSPSSTLSRGTWAWLAAMAYSEVQVVVASNTQSQSLIKRGFPRQRCHVVSPAIEMDRIKTGRDAQLRERLGLLPDDRVVLAAGDSTPVFGHRLALHAMSILHVLDRRYRLLIWGRGREMGALEHLARQLRQPRLLVCAESRLGHSVHFQELLTAADVALITAAQVAPVLPMMLCAAGGLPTVGCDTGLVREILGDQSVLLVPPAPRNIAQALRDLFDDKSRATAIASAARKRAHETFGLAAYVDALVALYRQTIDLHMPVGTQRTMHASRSSADKVVTT